MHTGDGQLQTNMAESSLGSVPVESYHRCVIMIFNYSHTGLPNGGVPQGTICGPRCFMIYINDLSTPVPLYTYVDDSTLFEICEINSISSMQESVNIAAEWTNNNDMKINSEKSKEMIISYAHGNIGNEVPNILIYGKVVERVDHVTLLGIRPLHCPTI